MNAKRYLQNVLRDYNESLEAGISRQQEWRIAGVIEATLVSVGVLEAGKSFPYIKVRRPNQFFGSSLREESYPMCMVRLAQEYLAKNQ